MVRGIYEREHYTAEGKKMNIYDENGYLNIEEIAAHPSWLKVIIGARQIGKTYGTLKYHLEHNIPHILLRRTTEELDMITGAETNPYKVFEPDYHTAIFKSGKFLTINDYEDQKPIVPARGMVLSLAQIAHIRGFSGSGYESIIFDEFIPEKHIHRFRSEGDALLNAYTTINGNRELQSRPPCRLWLLANSNDINNTILDALNLTDTVLSMRSKGWEYAEQAGALIVQPSRSAIVDKRKNTALMQMIDREGQFYGMAINNEFSYDQNPLVIPRSVKGMRPLFGYKPLYAWENDDVIYCCRLKHDKHIYDKNEWSREQLRADFLWIIRAYAAGLVTFSDLRMLALFRQLFKADF